MSDLAITVEPVSGVPDPQMGRLIPDSGGAFTLVNKQARSQRVLVSGLDSSHYIKSLRYNGSEANVKYFSQSTGSPLRTPLKLCSMISPEPSPAAL